MSINYFQPNCYFNVWNNYWRCYCINSEAAIQIALQRVPGKLVKVERDTENGVLVYEVKNPYFSWYV
ncbi:PepSY domain-containing protein [Clostridium thermarum]|uniref:PepSY domain-containing protein n=1 Tax=Clostridium thermarum TaxID=1716543 RepID=UPI001FACDA8F|nr:PepSY domain-containing protein [Clostridium thermarum]